jgi:3'-phosphoadenosine 5'-phosphosulfate (PAPS) 3'-phosphatase
VLGVVHVPVTGKTYYAVLGKGAFVRDAQGTTQAIQAKEFAFDEPGLVLVGSASHANPTNNSGVASALPA